MRYILLHFSSLPLSYEASLSYVFANTLISVDSA